jgi:hypothetical protein
VKIWMACCLGYGWRIFWWVKWALSYTLKLVHLLYSVAFPKLKFKT